MKETPPQGEPCQHCKGTGVGWPTLRRGGGIEHRPCPECRGSGVNFHTMQLELMPAKPGPKKKGGKQ